MDNLLRRFACINDCPTFETIGLPKQCPHCGSGELKLPDAEEAYETYRKEYVNTSRY